MGKKKKLKPLMALNINWWGLETRLSLILFNLAGGHLQTRLSTRSCQKEIYQRDGEHTKGIDCRT